MTDCDYILRETPFTESDEAGQRLLHHRACRPCWTLYHIANTRDDAVAALNDLAETVNQLHAGTHPACE